MLFGFYFLVANYGTDDEQQGRGTARMRQQGGQYGNKVPSLFGLYFLVANNYYTDNERRRGQQR